MAPFPAPLRHATVFGWLLLAAATRVADGHGAGAGAGAGGPTVAVIGCGPGGMSFLHAIEHRRRTLRTALAAVAAAAAANVTDARHALESELARLPDATCLERAAGPGGVWRSRAAAGSSSGGHNATASTTAMYDGLWTNGPKELIEFFDYTYADHFGDVDLPVYMPRAALHEYMVARVTRHSPDLFRERARFRTEVKNVTYLDEEQEFEIETLNLITMETTTTRYDKVVWAAGANGEKKVPRDAAARLRRFAGRVLHSSETATFREDVAGKTLLFVGASYSAEDLALLALKLGAVRIHVASRRGCDDPFDYPPMDSTSHWPYAAVELHCGRAISAADGRAVTLGRVAPTSPYFAGAAWRSVPGDEVTLEVDTVVFATGYALSTGMLEPRLRAAFTEGADMTLDVPEGWAMDANDYTDDVGDVAPEDVRYYEARPQAWRDLMSIDVPSFFFLVDGATHVGPLVELEASAWLALSLMTGRTPVPASAGEMHRRNRQAALAHLNEYEKRIYMDAAYDRAVARVAAREAADANYTLEDAYRDSTEEHRRSITEDLLTLGARLRDGGHGLRLGSDREGGLTDAGRAFLTSYMTSDEHRDHPPPADAARHRRTFRDYEDGDRYVSVYTGRKSVSLPLPWLDIEGDGAQLILGRPVLDLTHLFS